MLRTFIIHRRDLIRVTLRATIRALVEEPKYFRIGYVGMFENPVKQGPPPRNSIT